MLINSSFFHVFSGRGAVLALLKVGVKQLYLYDVRGTMHELHPLCVLDFYTHESVQRRGHGRTLFDAMLSVRKSSH